MREYEEARQTKLPEVERSRGERREGETTVEERRRRRTKGQRTDDEERRQAHQKGTGATTNGRNPGERKNQRIK